MIDNLGMLDELLNDDSDAMTAWEVEFIESIHKKRDRPFSEKQSAVLERIYRKAKG